MNLLFSSALNDVARTIDIEIADLHGDGAVGSFDVGAAGVIGCGCCGAISAATSCEILDFRRVERESDPSAMAAVLSLACPSCAQRGTLVLSYGPASSADDADVLDALGVRLWRRDHAAGEHEARGESSRTRAPRR